MARKHKARRFVESADSFKPRLPRGVKAFVQTRAKEKAAPTTARGARRNSDGPEGSMSKLARERGAFKREVARK